MDTSASTKQPIGWADELRFRLLRGFLDGVLPLHGRPGASGPDYGHHRRRSRPFRSAEAVFARSVRIGSLPRRLPRITPPDAAARRADKVAAGGPWPAGDPQEAADLTDTSVGTLTW